MQCVIHSFADTVREVEIKKLDKLAHVVGPPSWIKHRDDLVVTFGMVTDPLPGNQPSLVLPGFFMKHAFPQRTNLATE